MRDLQFYANECMQELDAIGIRYGKIQRFTVNTRAKKRFGQCEQIARGVYAININAILLDERNDLNGLKATIMHELLHSVEGCMNHGAKWKNLADTVSRKYGYTIHTRSTDDDKGICQEMRNRNEPEYRYLVRCMSCGTETKFQKAGECVKNPSRYRCGRCHGKLEVSGIGKYQLLRA